MIKKKKLWELVVCKRKPLRDRRKKSSVVRSEIKRCAKTGKLRVCFVLRNGNDVNVAPPGTGSGTGSRLQTMAARASAKRVMSKSHVATGHYLHMGSINLQYAMVLGSFRSLREVDGSRRGLSSRSHAYFNT